MLERIRSYISQTIELRGADRIAKEIRKGKLQAMLAWDPFGEPRYQLDIKRPTSTSAMLTLVGYEDDVTDDGKILLRPTLDDTPVINAAAAVNQKTQIGESLWFLTHETPHGNSKSAHKFRVELAPVRSTAVYVALESETEKSEGDRMIMHTAETHPND